VDTESNFMTNMKMLQMMKDPAVLTIPRPDSIVKRVNEIVRNDLWLTVEIQRNI